MVIHVGSANLSIKVRKNSNSFVFLALNGHANEAITKHIDMLTHDSVIFSSTVILLLPPRMGQSHDRASTESMVSTTRPAANASRSVGR